MVSFTCPTYDDAKVIREAVTLYELVLKARGTDPRNYAQAVPGVTAGFGWSTIHRAASDMHAGSITHMSDGHAEALRAALQFLASQHGPDEAAARRLDDQLSAAAG